MPNKIQYYKNLCENLQKKIKLIELYDRNFIPPERFDPVGDVLDASVNWLNTTFGNPLPGKGMGNLPVEGYPITKHYVSNTFGWPVDFPCINCRPVDGADPRYYPGIDQPNQPRPQLPERGSGFVPDIERAPTPETPGKNTPIKGPSIFDTDRPWTNIPDPLDQFHDQTPDWSVWYDKKRR